MKHTKKLLMLTLALAFALLQIGAFVPRTTANAAAGDITLKLNYLRYDQKYTNWDVWMWTKDLVEGQNSKEYEGNAFNEETQTTYKAGDTSFTWKQLSMTLEGQAGMSIGFIIRENGWSGTREPGGDRYIRAELMKNNAVEVFIIDSDPTIYYAAEAVDSEDLIEGEAIMSNDVLASKIKFASITSETNIQFSVNYPAFASNFTVGVFTTTDGTNFTEVPAANYTVTAEVGKFLGTIKFKQNLDFGYIYAVKSAQYGDTEVIAQNIGGFDSQSFEETFTYDGTDLGAVYTAAKTTFKLWAPVASSVSINLYEAGHGSTAPVTHAMTKFMETGKTKWSGVWTYEITGDAKNTYYTYDVTNYGRLYKDCVDPYAKATGVNGLRAMVVDLASTNPAEWATHNRPNFEIKDSILYEVHIRDFTWAQNSGVSDKNRGKYLGIIEKGTKNTAGDSTGIDHIKELGANTVHLLPSFDYRSVDEEKNMKTDAELIAAGVLAEGQTLSRFNWGYDPQHYNVPEGTYASDPFDGNVRINEYKQMVQGFHKEGIKVVMDVVYNHTGASEDSDFNKIVPYYYYRFDSSGSFMNGSGCGNETASERSMFRKYMIESCVYWATEYKIDGFRFDLMALHDIETMNQIRAALNKINPNIIIYGEGWTGGTSGLPSEEAAFKASTYKMPGIAAFSDNIRDGIKGNVFTDKDTGFVSGKQASTYTETVRFGITGAVGHPDVDFSKVQWGGGPASRKGWTESPLQHISYASAHDNNTLWDKFAMSNPDDSEADRIKMNLLSASIVYTAQGIPFMLSGEEILRSKPLGNGKFDHNSYSSSDEVNQIDWDRKTQYREVFDYYKGLIALRKEYSAMVKTTKNAVVSDLHFIDNGSTDIIAYTLKAGDSEMIVIHNSGTKQAKFALPQGTYKAVVKGNKAGTATLDDGISWNTKVDAISTTVLVKTSDANTGSNPKLVLGLTIGIIGAVVLGGGGACLFIFRDKIFKKKSTDTTAE